MDSGETRSGTVLITGIRNSQMADKVKMLSNSGGIKAGAIVMDPGSQRRGVLMIEERGHVDAVDKGNQRTSAQ